ncbi:sugar porter family MFS transporter [Arthrobacter rhombi]|uniref:sugar porter family MFS transporter n=1 Tax=Arthrobacter rhombi TaxID=71253 RepID=UPI003FD4F439
MRTEPRDPTPPAPAPKSPKLVYAVSAIAAVGGFLFGYDTGVISGALLFINDDFSLTPFTEGVVVSSILVGAIIGAVGCGPLSDRFGRKNTIITAAAVFTIGALLAAFAPTAEFLVVARLVLGVAVGAASVLVPLFIAEAAPPAIRGRLVSANQLLITIGILAAYLTNALFAYDGGWRWMFGLGVIPAIVLGVGMLFLPETPRWLFEKGRTDEARSVLGRLRDPQTAQSEYQEIHRSIHEDVQPKSTLRDLTTPWVRPALIAGIGVSVFGQASGINSVIYYAPTIFNSTGLGASTAILGTVGIGAVNVIMTIVGMSLVDRIGRRVLLMTGFAVMSITLLVLGFVLHGESLDLSAGWIAMVCLAIYIAAFGASVGIVVFVLPSEVYPQRIRGSAMSATLMCNWGMNFVVSLTFLSLFDALGKSWTFWLYALICALGWLFAVKLVPETKGRSLEEIESWSRARAT